MRKGNMTTLTSIFMIALVAAGIGMGTMAFFSDIEMSEGNVIVAGTIDLTLTGSFDFTDVKPCEDLDPIIIKFTNIGQNPGYLYYKFTYVENDKTEENLPSITADEFAALIYVKEFWYQHFGPGTYVGSKYLDMAGLLALDASFGNGDGKVSLYEIEKYGWLDYCEDDDPLPDGEGAEWTIVFHMADSLLGRAWGTASPVPEPIDEGVEDNAPQADGISLTLTFVLRQNSKTVNPLP